LGANRVDVADSDDLGQLRKRAQSRSVTFSDISGAQEGDPKSVIWFYLGRFWDMSPRMS
jgi:hypothetical protein